VAGGPFGELTALPQGAGMGRKGDVRGMEKKERGTRNV